MATGRDSEIANQWIERYYESVLMISGNIAEVLFFVKGIEKMDNRRGLQKVQNRRFVLF